MGEEESVWGTNQRVSRTELQDIMREALPFFGDRVALATPLAQATGIFPVDNAHCHVNDQGCVHVEHDRSKWLVRVHDLREDPGFYGLYPHSQHVLTASYEEAVKEADVGNQRRLEQRALDSAIGRIDQFDDFLRKWVTASNGVLVLPQYDRFYATAQSGNPLCLTVVEDVSDNLVHLTDPNDPHLFAQEVRGWAGLKGKLEKVYTSYARVAGAVPHNAAYIPTDLIGRWDQFVLLMREGGEYDICLPDIEPFVGVKKDEMRSQVYGIRTMAAMISDQLPFDDSM